MTNDDVFRIAKEVFGSTADDGLLTMTQEQFLQFSAALIAADREEKAEELYKDGWFACARILRGARAE